MKIFVLSPHRDDAAFSLALSITHWLSVGHEVTVINVFTRSLYAPYADSEAMPASARLDHVSTLRRHEDRAALHAVGVKSLVDLDLPHGRTHSARMR